jgi:ribosomal protein S19
MKLIEELTSILNVLSESNIKTGDRVRTIKMPMVGKATKIENGYVHFELDEPGKFGKRTIKAPIWNVRKEK